MADFDSLPILCYIYPLPPFLIITFYNAQRSRQPFIIICLCRRSFIIIFLTLSSTTVTHKGLPQRVKLLKKRDQSQTATLNFQYLIKIHNGVSTKGRRTDCILKIMGSQNPTAKSKNKIINLQQHWSSSPAARPAAGGGSRSRIGLVAI